jgi:hypothetical protein
LGLLLISATFLAYLPAVHGKFVWDDDAWTVKINGLLRDLSGLRQMWCQPTALQQYYPLSGTTFWLDYHLWGLWPLPYHVENILLHCIAALLFCRLLQCLRVPGAWLAAAIFALHPVMVESVGWITERKNVLSLVLYLAALLIYGRFASFWQDNPAPGDAGPCRWRRYALAWVLFVGALLAKTTAVSLPAVLLLISWWKRGRIRWREDVLPTLPFFVAAVGQGLLTAWLEKNHLGATGPEWAMTFPERCLIAGRALWFYANKLLWPVNLCFVYPRWQLDAFSVAQWLYPVTAAGTVLALWQARGRIGRGPGATVLYFAGTLLPLLGFVNAYFMRYSFVCDHWDYLPSLGLIALGAGLVSRVAERLRAPALAYGFAAVVLPVLGVLSWRQCAMYADIQTLWRTTIDRNPKAWLAYYNLGTELSQTGAPEEGIADLQTAVKLQPGNIDGRNNLGNALLQQGRVREAMVQFQKVLEIQPHDLRAQSNLALVLATSSDASLRNGVKAVALAEETDRLTEGKNPLVIGTLAAAYAEAGRFPEAVTTARRALQLAEAQGNAGMADMLRAQIGLYQAGSPFHMPAREEQR